MHSYYEAKAVIRYYGPGFARKWPDPPHRAFANLVLDHRSLAMFTRIYGPLYVSGWSEAETALIASSKDQLRTAMELANLFVPDPKRAAEMQSVLIRAWKGAQFAIVEIEHGIKLFPWFWVTEQAFDMKDTFPDGVTLFAHDTWNLIRAAFLLDYKAGRARVCKNPDCPTPYFLRSRKGQEFCSHSCAVLINVRRFREREQKKAKNFQDHKRGRRTKR